MAGNHSNYYINPLWQLNLSSLTATQCTERSVSVAHSLKLWLSCNMYAELQTEHAYSRKATSLQVFRDWAQAVGAGCFGAVRVRDVDVFRDAG